MIHYLNSKRVKIVGCITIMLCMLFLSAYRFDDKCEDSIYADASNWAYYEVEGDKPVDVFYVCPTVDMGRKGNFHADMLDESYRKKFNGALKQELGVFDESCNIYAPYYRQITFPVYSLEANLREDCIELAYQDVSEAFAYYLAHCDNSRPLIIAGFSQGADMDIRLLKEYFADPELAKRLVAVYAIGWTVTDEELTECPQLKMAEAESDTGVIISYNSEAESAVESMIVPAGVKTHGINPLNWRTDSEVADASLNKGACFINYDGEITKEVKALTGCYIDPVRGTLKVFDVMPEDYSNNVFPNGIYHLNDYQFFYRNLQENVKVRIKAYQNN